MAAGCIAALAPACHGSSASATLAAGGPFLPVCSLLCKQGCSPGSQEPKQNPTVPTAALLELKPTACAWLENSVRSCDGSWRLRSKRREKTALLMVSPRYETVIPGN